MIAASFAQTPGRQGLRPVTLPKSSHKIDKGWYESTQDPPTDLVRLSSPMDIVFWRAFATDPVQTASLWGKVQAAQTVCRANKAR
jgi:hypothetical protein